MIRPATPDDAVARVHVETWRAAYAHALSAEGLASLSVPQRAEMHQHAFLWVLEDNPRARRFYEAAGWTLDGASRPIEIFGTPVPEIRYEKSL